MSIGARSRVKPPATFTATLNATTNTRIDLAWAAVPTAFTLSAYILERSLDGATWTSIYSGLALTYADTGRSPATRYRYRVRVLDAQGHYSSYKFNSATTPNPPARAIITGHWTAILESQHNAGVPSAAKVTGVGAYLVRYNFGTLDTGGGGAYSFTKLDQDLSQCAVLGIKLMPLIVGRTFDGTTVVGGADPPTNPMPADLLSYAQEFATSASGSPHTGMNAWWWSPTVQDRFQRMCQAIGARYHVSTGARYDLRATLAGIATQETATSSVNGGTAAIYTAGNFTGSDKYIAANYALALKGMSDSITDALLLGRHGFMFNFLPGDNSLMEAIIAYVVANGGYVLGPDLVTGASGNANIVSVCYPHYQKVHAGTSPMPFKGRTLCSIQNGEWCGTGVGDSAASMKNLYNYGTSTFTYTDGGALDWRTGSPLTLHGFVPDYHTAPGAGSLTYAEMVAIMAAHPDPGSGFTTPEWDAVT